MKNFTILSFLDITYPLAKRVFKKEGMFNFSNGENTFHYNYYTGRGSTLIHSIEITDDDGNKQVYALSDIVYDTRIENDEGSPINKIYFTPDGKKFDFITGKARLLIDFATKTSPIPVVEEDFFEKLQARILQEQPRQLRVEKLLKDRKGQTLAEFLKMFFVKYNNEKSTLYADDQTVQTPLGKRRSLGDLFMICNYYFPTCTLKDVVNILYKVLPVEFPNGFRTSTCSQIKKRVWYYDPKQESSIMEKTKHDEYGFPVNRYMKNL